MGMIPRMQDEVSEYGKLKRETLTPGLWPETQVYLGGPWSAVPTDKRRMARERCQFGGNARPMRWARRPKE